jgi:hypothetical protein
LCTQKMDGVHKRLASLCALERTLHAQKSKTFKQNQNSYVRCGIQMLCISMCAVVFTCSEWVIRIVMLV